MVRRVGFGEKLPEDEPETKVDIPRDEPSTRPDPIPNAREAEPEDRPTPTYLRMNDVLFPVIRISLAVIFAFKVDSNIMFLILLFWAGKEAISLAQKVLNAAAGK